MPAIKYVSSKAQQVMQAMKELAENNSDEFGQIFRAFAEQGVDGVPVAVTELTAAQLATYTGRTGEVVEVTDLPGRPQYRWDGSVLVPVTPVVALGQQHVAVSKTDTDTSEAVLYSLTIPALMLGPNDSLRINTLWTIPSSATNKTLKVKVGTTAFMSSVQTTVVSVERPVLIRNRNARNSQIAFNAGQGTGYGTNGGPNATGAVDFAQEQTLTITGTWGTAGAGANSITLESVLVELLRASA